MTSYLEMATVQEKVMCILWFFGFSVIKTQSLYRTQYGKDLLSDNVIRRWLNQFQETDNVLHRKGAEDRALGRQMLIESRKLGHITCHERRACSSCLSFCSID
jgi:hypothetical protein